MQIMTDLPPRTHIATQWNAEVSFAPSLGAVCGRLASECPVRIGLALGGGFARGIAHAGVLRVLAQSGIPIHCITGISAGAVVAAAYASGATPEEIVRAGCSMRFGDVGRFSLGRLGLVGSQRMDRFLEGLLKTYRFESMRIPLGVVATDLATGEPAPFCRKRQRIRAHSGQLCLSRAV